MPAFARAMSTTCRSPAKLRIIGARKHCAKRWAPAFRHQQCGNKGRACCDYPQSQRAHMIEAARVQAAIEILDAVIGAARDGGPAADTLVSRYFATRRYAGSKDRRAVRELVYRAIRGAAERPASGRAAMLRVAAQEPALLAG